MDLIPHKLNLLIGANGSGKTTLINSISGVLRTDGGQIMLDGTDISQDSPEQVFHHGIIRTFQQPRLFENLSVMENLLMADSNRGESFRHALLRQNWRDSEHRMHKSAGGITESLSLDKKQDNLGYDLSGGQIKLLELGKTMMRKSAIILLDEPIAGINPVLSHEIFSKITSICRMEKTTFLIIEHRLDIALQYADHVFVMDKGRIIADDAPDRILDNPQVRESYIG